MSDAAYLAEDAEDCRHALAAAADLASRRGDIGLHHDKEPHWLHLAEDAYRFLRSRDSLRAIRVSIVPGTPYLEGTSPMTTTFNLDDTDEVVFSLTGLDAKGASVALDSGFTAAWTLADPDSTGAVLTVSDDTTTATVTARHGARPSGTSWTTTAPGAAMSDAALPRRRRRRLPPCPRCRR